MLPRALHPTMGKLRGLFAEGLRLTPLDAEARLFIDVRNAREYLKLLKGEGAIYIAAWRRDGVHGRWTPVYAARDAGQKDAQKPGRMTAAESRRLIRAEPERWQHELKLQRVRRAGRKFAAEGVNALPIDPLMAAFNRDATMTGL